MINKFATRLNSFKTLPRLFANKNLSIEDLIKRASQVEGLTHIDLNFPDHTTIKNPTLLRELLKSYDLELNGYAIRFYSDNDFLNGAYTNLDNNIRKKAIDLTLRAIDELVQVGGKLLTIWPGPEGFDYPFQIDYSRALDYLSDAISQVSEYNPEIQIAIEYKPNDPRSYNLLPNVASTLNFVKQINKSNLGITIDYCHQLMAGEYPAFALESVIKEKKLFGLHLNDGFGFRDDGLMIGTSSLIQTLEFFYVLSKYNYNGIIYFDTFPLYIDPVKECELNITTAKKLYGIVTKSDFKNTVKKLQESGEVSDLIGLIHKYLLK